MISREENFRCEICDRPTCNDLFILRNASHAAAEFALCNRCLSEALKRSFLNQRVYVQGENDPYAKNNLFVNTVFEMSEERDVTDFSVLID